MTSPANTPNTFSPSLVSPSLAPALNEQAMRAISDDECVTRLASVVDEHNEERLREVVMLISRLAVPIEL